MSKTNKKGIIEYANDYFVEVSGYEDHELIGQPHNVIRHPDMPKVIFKLMWEKLLNKENVHAIVKNLAKDGRFYWVITHFEVKTNEDGEITALYARRKAVPKITVEIIEKLYKKLLTIEAVKGVDVSYKYFEGFLEEKGINYDEYITSIVIQETPDLKKEVKEPKEKKNLIYNLIFKEYGSLGNFTKDFKELIHNK